MPKYKSGDYCDVYLTHDSMSVRKAHNAGRNHERNVLDYYQRTHIFPSNLSNDPLASSTPLVLYTDSKL
ncbi:MAG: hypothetical protein L6R40_007801 [Gallowayella cf. fulva]|nr:MAG: hypothetical protein L6R40_007801 [Xanthomendoza cf. fulva]